MVFAFFAFYVIYLLLKSVDTETKLYLYQKNVLM